MALKGVNSDYAHPLTRSSFRSGGWTQPEGGYPAFIHECKVVNVNYVNWTVDVRSQFDQKGFFDVQVASPYMHSNFGEGIYVVPEVNAKCLVCIPSDGPPPFVLAFIMPMESKDIPADAQPSSTSQGATFAGGRTRGKPGDIIIRGRDGNFMILHRGGVLEIGASPVAQRIYVPLQNIVTDVSQQYNHFNTGGAMRWGISNSTADSNPETEWSQTFRLYADDEKADVRVAIGKVHQPVPEPAGSDGSLDRYNEAVGDSPIALELVVAPGGFDAGNNSLAASAQAGTKLKLLFTRDGGGFLRAEGKVNLRIKGKLQFDLDDDLVVNAKGAINFSTKKRMSSTAEKGLDINSNGVVRLNGGSKPVATVGSTVNVIIKVPVPIVVGGTPGTITAGAVLQGQIASGNPTILA